MKKLIALAIVAVAIGHDIKAVSPYTYTADGRTAYGVTVDYSDGTYAFYDRMPTLIGRTEKVYTIADSVGQADRVERGIVVETFHSRNWTGSYTVRTESGENVMILDNPEDITSADSVTLYYTDGQLTSVLFGHR